MAKPRSTISRLALSFFRDDAGQDLVEYALIAALIGLGAVAAVSSLGTVLRSQIVSIASSFQNAI